MKEHITDRIQLYLDGEIGPEEAMEIEAHLVECEACSSILSRQERLSTLIRLHPRMNSSKTDRQFTAEVLRGIRADNAPADSGGVFETAWILIPLLVVAGLAFLQTVWVQSTLVMILPQFDEVLDMSQFLLPFSFAIPPAFHTLIQFLPGAGLWSWNWISTIILAIALALLYVSWMAGWWVRNQQHANA